MFWVLFVELYCIVVLGKLNQSKMIRFWLKFFDPIGRGLVPEHEYLDILEKLIRGRYQSEELNKANEATKKFAEA